MNIWAGYQVMTYFMRSMAFIPPLNIQNLRGKGRPLRMHPPEAGTPPPLPLSKNLPFLDLFPISLILNLCKKDP